MLSPSDCRQDLVRIIAQYLGDESYVATQAVLLDEENVRVRERLDRLAEVRRVKKAILEGDWPEVDRICGSMQLVRNQKPFLYAVYKQQYLEYIEHREVQKAFTHLTKRIKPLEQFQSTASEFRDMCYLLSAKSPQEVASFKHWGGITTSRELLASQFQAMFDQENSFQVEHRLVATDPASSVERSAQLPVLPPRRLITLLNQAIAHQIDSCRYKSPTAPRVTSLMQDYQFMAIPNSIYTTFTGHSENVKCAVFLGADGSRIASGSSDHTVRLWDVPEKAAVGGSASSSTVLTGHTARIWDIDSSRRGDRLASASADGTVRIWDTTSSSPSAAIATFQHTATDRNPAVQSRPACRDVYAVKYHQAGKQLVTGSYDKIVRLYDIERGTVIKEFPGHTGSVTSCVFSPLGNLVITGSKDCSIKFWDIVSGLCIRTITTLGEVTSVDISNSGLDLLSSSKDNTNRIWDVRLARPIRKLKGHQNTNKNFIRSCFMASSSASGYSSAGFVTGGSEDGSAYVWDAGTGAIVARLHGHAGMVYALRSNATQGLYVSCSDDGTVKTWGLDDSGGNEKAER
ncbi:MAG: hypothetical protein SGCHY_002285 [Lobulomycetales sp.]